MCRLRLCRSFFITSGFAGCDAAQGIVGAGTPQVAIGRLSGGTPAKPGFLQSKKCAQIIKD
jgi:hypothetical protein